MILNKVTELPKELSAGGVYIMSCGICLVHNYTKRTLKIRNLKIPRQYNIVHVESNPIAPRQNTMYVVWGKEPHVSYLQYGSRVDNYEQF